MMWRWPIHRSENDGSGTRMPSQVSIHCRRCAGSSAMRRRSWALLLGAQKNGVRLLRSRAVGVYDRRMRRARDLSCGDARVFVEFEVRRIACRDCKQVKRDRLDFLADNPFYTKRFGFVVGRRCRAASIQDVAREFHLD
jgi:hypothetical protein